jgi:large subunit ribosomal protein L35
MGDIGDHISTFPTWPFTPILGLAKLPYMLITRAFRKGEIGTGRLIGLPCWCAKLVSHRCGCKKESEMPKMKTKSGAKKRFKLTASGKIRCGQTGKRHGMIKRTSKQIRSKRGTTIMAAADAKIVRKYMPNG